MNEMNEEFGFSYFNFEDTKYIQVTEQKLMNSMIEWHDNVPHPFIEVDSIIPNAHHFGILRISTPKTQISITPLAILLNIDGSSSMDEIGSDKLTKINHIKHTLKNMIHVLIDKITETPNICIYISILLFTHDVKNLLQRIQTDKKFDHFKDDFILLNHQSMHLILEEIDRIRPWGCTNIEMSLKYAKKSINDFMQKNTNFRIAHIQLTDGQATAGKKRADELSSSVDTSYRNIFVGYGEDHDGHLLASLGEIYPTCDYRFIDSIERTGLVYGEIMYHLLYPYNDLPILIKMSPGTKIYNWKTNQWSSVLTIPPLSSDTEKVFQIKIDDLHVSKEDVWADLYYTNNEFIPFETAITLPSLISLPIKIPTTEGEENKTVQEKCDLDPEKVDGEQISGTKLPVDLTKYLLRQLTQECLYLIRHHEINETDDIFENTLDPPRLIRSTNQVSSYSSPTITMNELKSILLSNIGLLQYYRDSLTTNVMVESTQQDESSYVRRTVKRPQVANLPDFQSGGEEDRKDDVLFIQTLIDDLQTALTTLGLKQNFMYTTARQTSQGSQHTYSPYNTRYHDRPFDFRTYSSRGSTRNVNLCTPNLSGTRREDVMNTFNMYDREGSVHNQRQTSYINSDILSMMTQIQGMDNNTFVSDIENDITDSLDNLSQEPVVYNTHTRIPNLSENRFILPRIRTNSVNSESTVSTVSTVFSQFMSDDISDEE